MKALIIEDETLAAQRLEKLLSEVAPDIVVMARLTSVESAVKWFQQNRADLIFLDIQLTDGLCFSIFDQVEVSTPVVFVTAYDQYAIKAFKLNSISYLLKPIKKKELEASIQKYKSLKPTWQIDFDTLLAGIGGTQTSYKKRFLIPLADKWKKIETEEIAYFFALEKSVFLRTKGGQTLPLDMTLDQVESMVNPALFFRINRKYIINIHSIANMITWSKRRIQVELAPAADNSADTIVSMERYSGFKDWLDK